MSRRRYRKKSNFGGLFELLLELTGFVWQIGAVATVALLYMSYMAYGWADNLIAVGEKSTALSAVFANFGFGVYLLPLMLVILACLFGVKTFDSYTKGRF